MELKDLYELFLAGFGAGVLICRTKQMRIKTIGSFAWVFKYEEGSNAALPADFARADRFKSRCQRI
jgi:hypothetical protein